jgi:hypothetical protein
MGYVAHAVDTQLRFFIEVPDGIPAGHSGVGQDDRVHVYAVVWVVHKGARKALGGITVPPAIHGWKHFFVAHRNPQPSNLMDPI